MTLLNDIESIKKELAVKEAQLAFVSKLLPSDVVSRVRTCELKQESVTVVVDCVAGDLDVLLAAFPLRDAPQYLASRDGTPEDRETALSLQHPAAAEPVYPMWLRLSNIRGTAACWKLVLDGRLMVIEAQGAAVEEAKSRFLADLSQLPWGSGGYIMYQAPLLLPTTPVTQVDPANIQRLLNDVAAYLNQFLATEGPKRRGYAPARLLAYQATKQFGIRVEVSTRDNYSGLSKPSMSYSVSIKDSKGHCWHELSAVSMESRLCSPDDQMWFDLVYPATV